MFFSWFLTIFLTLPCIKTLLLIQDCVSCCLLEVYTSVFHRYLQYEFPVSSLPISVPFLVIPTSARTSHMLTPFPVFYSLLSLAWLILLICWALFSSLLLWQAFHDYTKFCSSITYWGTQRWNRPNKCGIEQPILKWIPRPNLLSVKIVFLSRPKML